MINWKWPNTKEKEYLAPWYVVLWRLPWYCLMLLTRFLFSLSVWACYLSYDSFLEAWDNNS